MEAGRTVPRRNGRSVASNHRLSRWAYGLLALAVMAGAALFVLAVGR